MKLKFLGGAAVAALALSVSGLVCKAGDRPYGVVELFTSQGCNSCPPADAVLSELSKRGDVITLGYHVNYWDYLGWRDTLATAENTARQHEYRKSFDARSVYTPQAVVNGRLHVNGAKRHEVESALMSLNSDGQGLVVDVEIEKRGDTVLISAGPGGSGQKAHLMIVYYDHAKSVDIGKGENGGRQIRYVNPVTEVQAAGMWHGDKATFELPASEIAKKGPGGCAVLLQSVGKDRAPGPILGAATLANGAT